MSMILLIFKLIEFFNKYIIYSSDRLFKYSKIVLFHRFQSAVDESSVEMAIAGIKALQIELVVMLVLFII